MQQTETYKLNIIEGSDAVFPDPINENMETIEGVLKETNAALTALSATVAARKFTTGTYTGNSGTQTITLSFTPKAVWIFNQQLDSANGYQLALVVTDGPAYKGGSTTPLVSIVTKGFQVVNGDYASLNYVGHTYNYVAVC